MTHLTNIFSQISQTMINRVIHLTAKENDSHLESITVTEKEVVNMLQHLD